MKTFAIAGVFAVIVVALTPATVASQDPPILTVQVFHLKHIAVEDASAAIGGRLSRDGSMTVRPSERKITVHDRADVIADVEKLIASIDQLPVKFRIRVELLEGSGAEYSVAELAEVPDNVKTRFPFAAYRRIGLSEFAGEAGDSATLALSDDFQIQVTVNEQRLDNLSFGIPGQGIRLFVRPFILQKVNKDGSSRPLTSGRGVLSEGQQIIVGATTSEDSSTGLVVIITAVSVMER